MSKLEVYLTKGSITSTNSLAYVKLGSGCPFPKSSLGTQFNNLFYLDSNNSPKIF